MPAVHVKDIIYLNYIEIVKLAHLMQMLICNRMVR